VRLAGAHGRDSVRPLRSEGAARTGSIGLRHPIDVRDLEEIRMTQPHYELTASEAVALIAKGELTAEVLVRSCLERIEEREADVGAWIYLDPDQSLEAARALDRSASHGPLQGIPIGIKDIIDTAQMPTAYGSLIYHSHRPIADATCVHLARAAGAVILGKTVSTEFAYRRAGKTSNPRDRRRSPGGSSSGSAAAVADRMVPLAIGTQTAGSVIRPASYCGVYGLKPSFNIFSFSGVRHIAESLDTLGCMARSIDDLALFRSVLLGVPHRPISLGNRPRIALCRTPFWEQAQTAMKALVEDSATRLAAAGAAVTDFAFKFDGQKILDASWTVTKFEGARAFGHDFTSHPFGVSSAVRETVRDGRAVPVEAYLDALRQIDQARASLESDLEEFDVIITPSAIGEAPEGLKDTGPVMFNFLWTAFYTPAITIPAGKGPHGLPLGLQLVGRRYHDERLLQTAKWIDAALDVRI
jgi:Asp-tRNA(Asn)/Glu-tRNA(Gln) amidotransferase A subunit family amidase